MARRSYGDEVKARVKRFFEALLAYLNHEYEDGDTFGIKFDWQGETEVVVNGKRRSLEALTFHDCYEGQLTAAQVREAIKYLEEFLKILKDNRATKKGSEEWHFTLKLWHRDKAENLRQFDLEWDAKRPAKSKAVAENKKDTGISPDPEPIEILALHNRSMNSESRSNLQCNVQSAERLTFVRTAKRKVNKTTFV